MYKAEIRNKIKLLRKNYNEEELNKYSEIICSKFYENYGSLSTFLMYYPINNEVNILNLINRLYLEGKLIYLPSVKNKNIVFKKFNGIESLQLGSFNVLEPTGDEYRPLDSSSNEKSMKNKKADIICIPGVAFDEECNRIGYGGGFYDRFLETETEIKRVALAYDFQIINNKIETENFDQAVDEIITEERIIIGRN